MNPARFRRGRFGWPIVHLGAALLLPWLGTSAEPVTRARYLALTAQEGARAPFVAVDFLRGPAGAVGKEQGRWWQLEVRAAPEQSAPPLFIIRALATADPLGEHPGEPRFLRYVLRLPEFGETLDYRDRHTGRALLPAWQDFARWFVPHPAAATRWQQGVPETAEYLGHILTLAHLGRDEAWEPWPDARVLELDRELLVGTGRNFKDKEGRRLPQKPQRQNYTYIPFEEPDYQVMIEAGINLFTIQPRQEAWVRARPVFYLRGVGDDPPLRYPADLYRANYIGPTMFMDEPSILMVGDKNVHNILRFFSDAAALIEKRTRSTYLSEGSYGAFALEKALRGRGVNFGDMRLMQSDLPSWETYYDTTFYQMKGGGAGLVHEGRYQTNEFDAAVARVTGKPRHYTARELLLYHYAFLRGGTRPFGKFWGTAIYGQCDPVIAPEAVTLAYDLGARYLWFWTSDHDHHVPWPEQLALARHVRDHAAAHPRPSIYGPPPRLDTAIVIPNGYFLSLENLWWVRVMDKEGRNDAAQRYRRLLQRAFDAVNECLDQGQSFDITVDDGRKLTGYRRVIRLRDE